MDKHEMEDQKSAASILKSNNAMGDNNFQKIFDI